MLKCHAGSRLNRLWNVPAPARLEHPAGESFARILQVVSLSLLGTTSKSTNATHMTEWTLLGVIFSRTKTNYVQVG